MEELFSKLGFEAMRELFDALAAEENRWQIAERFKLTKSEISFLDKNFRLFYRRLQQGQAQRLRRMA